MVPWACAPSLHELACIDTHLMSPGVSAALARHTATLTALTALTWLGQTDGASCTSPAEAAAAARRAAHAVGDPGSVGAFAASLWELPQLRALKLAAPDTASAATAVLAAALRSCTLLTRLSLHLRSFELFAGPRGSGGGAARPLPLGVGGISDVARSPLQALTNLQHLSLRAGTSTLLWPQGGGSGWDALPRSVNELVADLVAAPLLTSLCLSEVGCTRDSTEFAGQGSVSTAALAAGGGKAGRQGGLRGGGGEGGGAAARLSQHFSRLTALQELSLEFDFCYVAALAPQLERLRRLERLQVRAGAGDGRREVLRRLRRSTVRLPLRKGVWICTDLSDA